MHVLAEPQLRKRFPQTAPIVCTQNLVLGLNLYLDLESICVVGFEFPTIGGPILGDPNALLFPQILLFTSQSHSFSLLI